MARYIDADLLKQNCKITNGFDDNFKCVSLKTLGEVIDKQPTENVEPVVHGHWIETRGSNKKRCSECGVIHLIAQYPTGNSNFCPNCGAKMDGKEVE